MFVEHKIQAIAGIAAGHEGPATVPAAAEEVAVVERKVVLFDIVAAGLEVGSHSAGLQVEAEVLLQT